MSNTISGNIQAAGAPVICTALGEVQPVQVILQPQAAQTAVPGPQTPGTTTVVYSLTAAQSLAAGNASPADGDYSFTGLPAGMYQIQASTIGTSTAAFTGFVYLNKLVVFIEPANPQDQTNCNLIPVAAGPAQGSNNQDHSNNAGRNYIVPRG